MRTKSCAKDLEVTSHIKNFNHKNECYLKDRNLFFIMKPRNSKLNPKNTKSFKSSNKMKDYRFFNWHPVLGKKIILTL